MRNLKMLTHRLLCSPLVSVCAAYCEGRGEECVGWKGVEELPLKKLKCLTPVLMRFPLDIPQAYIVITLYLQQGREKR
jgi:hypothetical protein